MSDFENKKAKIGFLSLLSIIITSVIREINYIRHIAYVHLFFILFLSLAYILLVIRNYKLEQEKISTSIVSLIAVAIGITLFILLT